MAFKMLNFWASYLAYTTREGGRSDPDGKIAKVNRHPLNRNRGSAAGRGTQVVKLIAISQQQ